ncbi:hypothetical protein SBA6_120003 [Candidatus Sulfopaludibacter sp. SbA6]|nr:hypothetical protein SBA6_120003 [Candidatus Sulfopaludibacter sp. SbA6]
MKTTWSEVRFNKFTPAEPPTFRSVSRGRCRCGQCARSLDNERWERIFEQNFADPDYYEFRLVRHASPLGALG